MLHETGSFRSKTSLKYFFCDFGRSADLPDVVTFVPELGSRQMGMLYDRLDSIEKTSIDSCCFGASFTIRKLPFVKMSGAKSWSDSPKWVYLREFLSVYGQPGLILDLYIRTKRP